MNTRFRFSAPPKKERPKFLWVSLHAEEHDFLKRRRTKQTREKWRPCCGQIE
jgi:hypothetical protein